jgi:hypothetical protein
MDAVVNAIMEAFNLPSFDKAGFDLVNILRTLLRLALQLQLCNGKGTTTWRSWRRF